MFVGVKVGNAGQVASPHYLLPLRATAMPSIKARVHGLVQIVIPVMHVLATLATIFLLLLGFGICSIVIGTNSSHGLLYIAIISATTALSIYLVQDKKRDFLTLVGRLDAIAASKDTKQPSADGVASQSASQSAPQNHARDMARDVLEKAADSLLGPVFIAAVGVPFVLILCALAAHTYGHDYIAALCTILAVLSIALGLGPYFLARTFLSYQFDRILSVFGSDPEKEPLLTNKR